MNRLRRSAGGWCAIAALCAAIAPRPATTAHAQDGEFEAALQQVRADEAQRVAVFDRAARSVVAIFASGEKTGGGSGVIFDERGYGLTNYHVVAEFVGARAGVGGLSDGRLYPLTLLGIDPGGDIALFRLSGKERFDASPLGDSDRLAVGQWVAAMGNPFLLAEDYTPTITLGVISGLHRYQEGQGNALEYADCIQVSSSINPGNSGGPLFDMRGRVIGINGRASFEERGRVNVGLGYAVSINQVKRFLPGLRAGRLVEHGTLGATVTQADDLLIFDAVQDAAPAARAGVQVGDVLLSVDGRPLRTPNDFNNRLAIMPADFPLRLSIRRGQGRLDAVARLERLPIRDLPPFVPDLAQNHRELRRLLADARTAAGDFAPPLAPLAARVCGSGVSADAALELEFDADGNLCVRCDGGRRLIGADAAPAAMSAVARGDDEALWSEWRAVVDPLRREVDVDATWELIGGDDIAGRIAYVVERRLPEKRRIRWFFDIDTHALLEATLHEGDRADGVIWVPRAGGDAAAAPQWLRYANDGVIAIELSRDPGSRVSRGGGGP